MNTCILRRGLTGLIVDLETHPECGTGSLERPAHGGICARHEDGYSLIDRWAFLKGPIN